MKLALLSFVICTKVALGGVESEAAVTDLTHPSPPVRRAELHDVAFDMNKAALVIVDMQNYFLKSSTAPGLALVGAINATAEVFRAAGAPVVFVNWGMRPDYADWTESDVHPGPKYARLADFLPPVKGSHDAELYPDISFDAEKDILVDKHRLTGFYKSQLDDILRFRGLQTLFFGGVNTDQCVFGTLIDASHLGYDTFMVKDLTATNSPQFAYDAAIFNSPYATTSSDLIAAIRSASTLV